MATDTAATPVNGNYGSQQAFGTVESHGSSQTQGIATGTNVNGTTGAQGLSTTAGNSSSSANEGNGSVPKDEVGWYFVEQYYTTLSRNPEKLHLFYSKRSQFVSGVEAEKVSVSVGQRAINERIRELDIQDCKVRVSNVDSQESFKNIVVQVIGEMSNKAAPHRKFVQTFVLAEQPNGYFVLNDIFRYISEDEEEDVENEVAPEAEHAAASALEAEPKTLTSSDDPVIQEQDAQQVDKKLEEQIPADAAVGSMPEMSVANGDDVPKVDEVQPTEIEPAASIDSSQDISEDQKDESEPAPAIVELEKPKDPDPTPVASPPKPVKAVPAQAPTSVAPPKPAAPKTWANLVAANRIASPAAPSSTSSASPAPTQPKTAPPAASIIAPPTPASDDVPSQPLQSPGAGWQTAGQDNAKRQGRQQSISGPAEKDNVLGYVKNVTERVDASLLKAALLSYGKLAYFDVSRQKNCAFVEFADPAGYNAAVAANPHEIGGEQIYVEERRPRPNAYGGGFNNRGGMRGGRGAPDGGRPSSQGRGGYPKDGGRGGYVPRGRGGNMTPRGRGQPQAA